VLLHQFHDILPGSSIAWVHRESRETYARLRAELEEIIRAAQRALAGEATSGGEVVFNAAPHARDGVPARGATRAPAPPAPATRTTVEDGGYLLDNGIVRATVDARGLLVSVVDLATGREAIAPGSPGNLLQLHPDLPAKYDAWDVDHTYRRTVTDVTGIEALEPEADAAVRVVRRFGSSRVTQVISLPPGAGRVDIDTEVDWHEAETFLKVAFPLDLRAERSAAETQFGHVYRATDTNTTWEAAKYEICAHRYLHVGEPGFGVALVNDSTYGHDVTRDIRPDGGTTTTVRLSLLRAPRFPDPETDQGVHRMRFALVPGADLADATREGYRINVPERRVPGDAGVEPLVRVDGDDADGVVISAVKLADDGSGDVVVRLYEAVGARAAIRLDAGFAATGCAETDLLERPLDGGLTFAGSAVELTLRPFQVVTLRFSLPGGDQQ
jgi:alpha-mannosidase